MNCPIHATPMTYTGNTEAVPEYGNRNRFMYRCDECIKAGAGHWIDNEGLVQPHPVEVEVKKPSTGKKARKR